MEAEVVNSPNFEEKYLELTQEREGDNLIMRIFIVNFSSSAVIRQP